MDSPLDAMYHLDTDHKTSVADDHICDLERFLFIGCKNFEVIEVISIFSPTMLVFR